MPTGQTVNIPPRIPLVIDPENRDSSPKKDAKLVNCYGERDKQNNFHIYRRPGTKLWGNPSGTNVAGQGVFYWNHAVYSIFNGVLYKNLSGTGVTTLDSTGGVYSFSSIMGGTPKLVFQNGNFGYAYDDVNSISSDLHTLSPSYPQYTVKGLAYLDGTMYVMQHFFGASITPAVIWGSGINDVTTANIWDPLNFITAQIEPDSGVYLAKQLIYVVALKEWTTEVFFDAGNAEGIPLGAVENAKISYGCAHEDSVQKIDDVLFFMSTTLGASNQVMMLNRLQPRIVSTPEIDRLLETADLTTVYSWSIKLNGHNFYVLTIKNENITLAYDITQNMWGYWTDTNGNYMPIVSSCRDNLGNHILQHESNGNLYYSNSTYMDDDDTVIPLQIITPNFDAGTRRQKQMGMLGFIADQSPLCSMSVSYSDDDYQTWSTPQSVDLGYDYPTLTDLGSFRKRAFKFTVNNNAWFRLSAMETQFDIGTL